MLRRLRSLSSSPLAFLLVLLVFQASQGFAGLNLCIGQGGHVEIEPAGAGCCPGSDSHPAEPARIQDTSPCASCIDVSLGDRDAGPLTAAAPGMPTVFLPPSIVLERMSPQASGPASARDQGNPPGMSLAAVRSIVLRL